MYRTDSVGGDPRVRDVAIEALHDCHRRLDDLLPAIVNQRFEIAYKPDGSPVTSADRLLEKKICDWLSLSLGETHFIGEETYSGSATMHKGWVAVVDPIDGTENFCSGLREWGVSIALWYQRQHMASALLLPELRDALITGDACPSYKSRITAFSSSYSEEIARGLADATEYRVFGCAVYNLLNVIRGSVARFVNPKGANSWDILAGLSLAVDYGCRVAVDGELYDGRFLEPVKKYRIDIHHR